MSKNYKNTPNSHSTSIVASTLMQKMLDGHTKTSIQNQQFTFPLDDIHITKRKMFQPCEQIQTSRKLPPTPTTTQPQFKLNLQYYHPTESPSKNISNFMKLKNNSRLRQLKQLDQLTVEQRESNMIRHLRKNLVSLYGDKNMKLQRQRESMMKSQSDESLRQDVKIEASETQEKDRSVQRQKLPAKVSVNFQLYFPKQKLRTTINTAAKTQTRRSINIKSNIMQKQLFRIKKSSKSISLSEANEKTMLQLSSDLRQQKRERQRFHEQVLVSLRKNSAIKYIEKIEKFKKYKDKRINKQPLFGLNVTQAEYHEVKVDSEGKKIKDKNTNQMFLKEQKDTWNKLNQTEEQQRDIYIIDHKPHYHHHHHHQHHHRELTVNLSISVGPNLSLKNPPQKENSESKVSPLRKSQPIESRQKERKCPSEHKLAPKGFFGGGNSEIQKSKKYMKTRQEQTWNRGGDNVLRQKLINMLACLDVILNAYCCKVAADSQTQKKGGVENKTAIIDSKISDTQVLVQSVNDLSKSPQEGTLIASQNNMLISTAISPRVMNFLKGKEKFLYFVGNGNNKNLIRSIMKKRGWWSETEKMQEANFVWTQLKIGLVLDREEKMSDKVVEEPDSWHYKKGQQPEGDDIRLPRTTKLKMLSHDIQKYQKVFHKNMLPLYHKRLTQKHNQHQYLRPLAVPVVMHNHYDANYMLGNKKALFYNITQYCSHKKISPYTFIPMTFHIESTQSRQFKSLFKTAKKYKNALWIVKPGENSNRGNGIFVEKDVEKIKKYIEKNATDKHSFIVQKYMKSIFLYNKRKFDIRVYMLMATIAGITKFFWYEEGYIRTSSEIYNTNDITDLFVHLTNDAIQVKNDTYSKYEKGNKVSYSEFQRYLDVSHSQEKYSVTELAASMKAIAETVVKATYSKLDKGKKVNGFQLFGLDFLIDKDFAPWLLQVNTNPCLELSSPVLQRLIPRMLENMFRMTIDPIYRPTQNISRHSSYFLYDNMLEKNKFELIFDSLFDCDFQWEEICQKEKNVVYEDEDQVFESNGVQMEVGD